MIRFACLLPFFFSPFHRIKKHDTNKVFLFHKFEPFSFPNGMIPNISDPSTYEIFNHTNETEYFITIDEMVIYTLQNESKWETNISLDIIHP